MTALLTVVSAMAVFLAALTTGWFLLILAFSMPAAFGAWPGLSSAELLEALDGGDDPHPGRHGGMDDVGLALDFGSRGSRSW